MLLAVKGQVKERRSIQSRNHTTPAETGPR